MEGKWSNFWWKNITGAHFVVKLVADALLDNKTAVLNVPYDLPWRHDMRAEVENMYRSNAESSHVIIDTVDDTDDRSDETSAGKYLLGRYGQKREIITGYRERSGKSIQDYLINNGVLRNRIIWVKGLTEKSGKEWVKFVTGYKSNTAEDGLFVLEVPGLIGHVTQNNVNIIRYTDYVSVYDVQLMSAFMLADDHDLNEDWKQYISNVVAKLCDIDAEAAEWLILNTNFTKMDPVDAIGRMSAVPAFSKRGQETKSTHALSLFRNNNRNELENRVWSAQVRTLFPLIEFEKRQIIEAYHEEIRRTLIVEDYRQYEKEISDPYELEIGSLYHLTTHRGASGDFMLEVHDELKGRIRFLRDCRNTLAHIRCCTPDEVDKLISGKIRRLR